MVTTSTDAALNRPIDWTKPVEDQKGRLFTLLDKDFLKANKKWLLFKLVGDCPPNEFIVFVDPETGVSEGTGYKLRNRVEKRTEYQNVYAHPRFGCTRLSTITELASVRSAARECLGHNEYYFENDKLVSVRFVPIEDEEQEQ